jgi:hypothetical protein
MFPQVTNKRRNAGTVTADDIDETKLDASTPTGLQNVVLLHGATTLMVSYNASWCQLVQLLCSTA